MEMNAPPVSFLEDASRVSDVLKRGLAENVVPEDETPVSHEPHTHSLSHEQHRHTTLLAACVLEGLIVGTLHKRCRMQGSCEHWCVHDSPNDA